LLDPKSFSEKEFKDYVIGQLELINKKKCRVILAVSDNVLPGVDFKRVEWLSRIIQNYS